MEESRNKVSVKEIQKLRKMIPVGMMNAKQLLESNNGDLEKSRSNFIKVEVERLCLEFEESTDLVGELFFAEDYDYNRTVDRINDIKFDRQYSKEKYKSTKQDVNMLDAWLLTIYSHGLMNSLQTADFDSIILVVKEIGLIDFSRELGVAYKYLEKKEEEFKLLAETELLGAVEGLKNSKEYQSILESYKMNVALNPDFFKVLDRLRKNVE